MFREKLEQSGMSMSEVSSKTMRVLRLIRGKGTIYKSIINCRKLFKGLWVEDTKVQQDWKYSVLYYNQVNSLFYYVLYFYQKLWESSENY